MQFETLESTMPRGTMPVSWSNGGRVEDRKGRVRPYASTESTTSATPFEPTSKRRRGYTSETHVKRGVRVVHGNKELSEKLGRNDLCPCGSGRRFQALLHGQRAL